MNNQNELRPSAKSMRQLLAEANSSASHSHCWHPSGKVYNMTPPVTTEICCHCGAERGKIILTRTRASHGRFLPETLVREQ